MNGGRDSVSGHDDHSIFANDHRSDRAASYFTPKNGSNLVLKSSSTNHSTYSQYGLLTESAFRDDTQIRTYNQSTSPRPWAVSGKRSQNKRPFDW